MASDCQRCGACCVGLDVLLTDAEAERFESRLRLLALTRLHAHSSAPPLPFMKRDPTSDRCMALQGALGQCACGIYDERPALCRAFAAGSADCQSARRQHGLPAEPS
jgi:Fe-S-cluster containining protein